MKKIDRVLLNFASGLLLTVLISGHATAQENLPEQKNTSIKRHIPKAADTCVNCHKQEHPNLSKEWENSRHASAGVTCYDCHASEKNTQDINESHYKQYERTDWKSPPKGYRVPITAGVTPNVCSKCHPNEVNQYNSNKHSSLQTGQTMNNSFDKTSGCYHCHGTASKMTNEKVTAKSGQDKKQEPVSVGENNKNCSNCHIPHRFSKKEEKALSFR